MSETTITLDAPDMPSVPVPDRLQDALNAEWLDVALAPVSAGRKIVSVELVELIRTVASKARIAVTFEGEDEPRRYCLKAFFDQADPGLGGATTIREADFYTDIAPRITMRVPHCANVVLDRRNARGILVMDDLTAAGARFCTALDRFEPEFVERTLDQIARLHAADHLLDTLPWLTTRIEAVAASPHLSHAALQRLLDDQRGETLDARTRDAALLLEAMKRLADRARAMPQTLLHGDCHAGNLYVTVDGPGFTDWQLIQRGGWALDVAYHIAAVLPVDLAARHERDLLRRYVEALHRHGGPALDQAQAWDEYRAAQPYGFYQWAITQMTPRPIIDVNVERLGAAVARLGSYELLGL